MNPRPQLRLAFILVFLVTVILTFPLHHLKDWMFEKINKSARGQVQLYASDLGFGIRGLTLNDVHLLLLSQAFEVNRLTIRPSLFSLFRGVVGISVGATGVLGSDMDLMIGKGFGGIYVSLDTDDLSLSKISIVKKMIPSLEGNLELDGGMKLKSLGMPIQGSGSFDIEIPKLNIPQKTNIAGFGLPPIKGLSPGLKGSVILENDLMRLRQVKIGKKGQAIWGSIDGSIRTGRTPEQAELDLTLELTLGPDLKNNPDIKSIIGSSIAQPFIKNSETIAMKLTGPISSLMPQPL